MRLATALFLFAATTALAVPAHAQRGPLDPLLDAHAERAAVLAHLKAFADSAAARDPATAALALGYAAQGYAEDGEADSAVIRYQRALTLEPRPGRRMDLARALLARVDARDAVRARDVLRPIQPVTPQLPEVSEAPRQGWFAWSHYLAGNADSAALLFPPVESWLLPLPEWRYRMACVAHDRSEWIRVMNLLTPLAVVSRTSDRDVMELLGRAAERLGADRRLRSMLLDEIRKRDLVEKELTDRLGGKRVHFDAADGFPLSSILFAPARVSRPRSAVVLMAPGDTLELYDSLAVGLRRMGFAVLMAEVRGWGRSVAPGCPSPAAWRGRETQMRSVAAGDVRAAVTALGVSAHADTSGYLLIGVGATAPIAVRAAELDRRARALMLVSPTVTPVDRGPLRAILARIKRPVYFQTGPEDFTTWGVIDALYQACDPRASRVADSDQPGSFATLFRRDPKIFTRFKQWLAEAWPARSAPRATPPSAPRKG